MKNCPDSVFTSAPVSVSTSFNTQYLKFQMCTGWYEFECMHENLWNGKRYKDNKWEESCAFVCPIYLTSTY